MQNVFISCFAPDSVNALVIIFGALFHNLAESMLKLSLAALDLAESFQTLVVPGLTFLSLLTLFGLFGSSWTGYEGILQAFHVSINLISPASWLTDWRFYFSGRDFVVTCSFSDTPSSILNSLFCASCADFMWRLVGSSGLVLTWFQRCNPYLSLQIVS